MELAGMNLSTPADYYGESQIIVEEEIRKLIIDNHKLSKEVEALRREKLESAEIESHTEKQSKDNEELRKQVALLSKERDSLYVLWQTSQKTIEELENELKTYGHSNNQNFIDKKRDVELKLEVSLRDYLELEQKHNQLIVKQTNLENEIKLKDKDIKNYKEQIKTLQEQILEGSKSLDQYRVKIDIELKNNEDLERKLHEAQHEIKIKMKNEADVKLKVAEALQLYDIVSNQKNELVKKKKELEVELENAKQSLANVRSDVESVCLKEVSDLKNKYNERVNDMLEHIKNLDAELIEKGSLLNEALRENTVLRTENENYLQQEKEVMLALDPKIALAEQKIEALFNDLVSSEHRNMQAACEKQCLALDLQRVQGIHEREIKRRDWEEQILRTHCDELTLQITHLQTSLNETHGMVNKLQTILASRNEINDKMITLKEDELAELNKHLHDQMVLNKKWKDSYIDMSEKMKGKLKMLYNENNKLRASLNLPHLGSTNTSISS